MINLALQGGGVHGAFTWGVLDELLTRDETRFGWISGTSAGAVNAVVMAAGLARGGPDGARQALSHCWEGVMRAGMSDWLRLNPWLIGLARAARNSSFNSALSPYERNPLGIDPLRALLEQIVDFEQLRRDTGPELLIAATDVMTGRPRIFRRRETTVEVVLASACLPMVHHAVEIDGRAYWDGGFSANPDLLTLVRESPIEDTLIVQLNPREAIELPVSGPAIIGNVNRLTFQAPLIRDVEVIMTARRAIPTNWRGRPLGPMAHYARHRLHLISAGEHVADLGHSSKLEPDRGVVTFLHGAGRIEAHKWLAAHRGDIGRRETADIAQNVLGMRSAGG